MPEKLDHEKIREAVKKLPAGTKERIAWEQYGDGNVTREEFRDLWLKERISPPEKPQEAELTKPSDSQKDYDQEYADLMDDSK